MRFEDYYQVMGLPADADAAAVKQAYRRLARQYHPDLNSTPEAHASMLKVNEAYEVLSDAQRRAAYDGVHRRQRSARTAADADLGTDWKQGFDFKGAPVAARSRDGSGEGFSDFFTSMFGRAAQPDPDDAKPERGADEHVRLSVDAADAAYGAVRSVTVRTLVPDAQGHRGTTLRTLQVQVPKGVRAGQHIRLVGQGSAGRGGAAAGDLYVEVQFKPGGTGAAADGEASRDVHAALPLAPWEAALGAEVVTTTPAGEVSVTVPPDTPHGKRLRLRGRGLQGAATQSGAAAPAGDMVLETSVVLPPSTLPGAPAAYKAMEAILDRHFKPRAGTRR